MLLPHPTPPPGYIRRGPFLLSAGGNRRVSFIENAVAHWVELQRFQSAPGWKLTNANPWVLALFRGAFTRTRPRVGLVDFHAMTDSIRLCMDGVPCAKIGPPPELRR